MTIVSLFNVFPSHLDPRLIWCRLDAHLIFTSDSFYTVSKSDAVGNKSGSVSLKKIQDRVLKIRKNPKWILLFFNKQINPRSLGSWSVKGTEESNSRLDSPVPWTHRDPKDLGVLCLVKKRKILLRILSCAFAHK